MAKRIGILAAAALITIGLIYVMTGPFRDNRIVTVAGDILLPILWFATIGILGANRRSPGIRKTPVTNRAPVSGSGRTQASFRTHSRPDWGTVPKSLDLQKDTPLEPLAERLAASLDPAYVEKVRNRCLKDHPEWTAEEFDWALFELKRFFLMSAILRYTPMYSQTVDEVWHTMLLFTLEYEDFCTRFAGRMIHHVPNPEPILNPGERAWFDWTYHQIFHPLPYSWFAWNGFFRYPLPADLIQEFEESEFSALQEKYFRPDTPYAHWLVNALRDQISQAKIKLAESSGSTKGRRTAKKSPIQALASGAASMVYFSLAAPEQFAAKMVTTVPTAAAAAKRDRSGSGSSCGSWGYYWGDGDSHHHSPGHNGSSCGGNSCGSSCGSSCGGGCGGS